jgi:hypothetical protein
LHRVFLTELDDPDKFAGFYAIFHADSLLGTGMFAQNTGWLLRETGERQEKVSVELYREYAERRVELIQELQAKGVTELDRAIEAAQRLLDRILFIAFAEGRGLLPDRNLLNRTAFVRVACLTGWQAFQLLFPVDRQGLPAQWHSQVQRQPVQARPDPRRHGFRPRWREVAPGLPDDGRVRLSPRGDG